MKSKRKVTEERSGSPATSRCPGSSWCLVTAATAGVTATTIAANIPAATAGWLPTGASPPATSILTARTAAAAAPAASILATRTAATTTSRPRLPATRIGR